MHPKALLALKESPWGSDYNAEHDCLVIGTSGGFSFFPIQEAGTPQKIVFYDFCQVGNVLKVQPGEKSIIASVLDCQVLLWDPMRFVSPLTNLLPQPHGPIRELQWSFGPDNTLATLTESDVVSLWDIRAPLQPTHDMIVGRPSHRLAFCPSNPHMLSANVEDRFIVTWDTRMGGANEFCQMIEVENGVVDYCWSSREQEATVHVLNDLAAIDSWALRPDGTKVQRACRSSSSCGAIDHGARLLGPPAAHPSGNLALYRTDHGDKKVRLYDIHCAENRYDAVEVVVLDNKVLNSFWRCTATNSSLLVLTDNGMLHAVPFIAPPNADDDAEYDSFKDDALANVFILSDSDRIRRKKLTNPSFKTTLGSHDSIDTRYLDRGAKSKALDRHAVVGPVTFMLLVGEELHALESGISNRLLEGIRLESIDQFSRQIVLSLLVPRRDRFAITMKNYSTNFGNYYDQQEVESYYSNPPSASAARTVALTISFPVKFASFWNLKFSVENRSSVEFNESALEQALIDELDAVVKARLPVKFAAATAAAVASAPNHRHGSASGMLRGPPPLDFENALVFQISKCFRKRIFRLWEKTIEQDNPATGRSFNSVKQSIEVALSFASDSDIGKDDSVARYLSYVETGAFKVPFPSLSGGVFNSRGELVLFGCAQFISTTNEQKEALIRNRCPFVEKLPSKVLSISSSNGLSGKQEDSRHPTPPELLSHKSYAHLMCVKFIKKSVSEVDAPPHPMQSHRKRASSASFEAQVPDTIEEEQKGGKDDEDDDDSLYEDEAGLDAEKAEKSSDEDEDSESSSSSDSTDGPFSMESDNEQQETKRLDTRDRRASTETSSNKVDAWMAGQSDMRESPTIDVVLAPSSTTNTVFFAKEPQSSYFVGEDVVSISDTLPADPTKDGSETPAKTMLTVLSPVSGTNVSLYSLGPLMPSIDQATDNQQRAAACRRNAEIAGKRGPTNAILVQIWSLLAVALDVLGLADNGGLINWANSSLGCTLFNKIVGHLETLRDLQVWAVTICIAGGSRQVFRLLQADVCNTVLAQTPGTHYEEATVLAALDQKLYSYAQCLLRKGDDVGATEIFKRMQLLDISCHSRFDLCQKEENRLCVRVVEDFVRRSHESLEDAVGDDLWECGHDLQCALCLLNVSGLYVCCEFCGHGGHADHLSEWFRKYDECPTGCTCRCRSTLHYEDVDFEDDVADSYQFSNSSHDMLQMSNHGHFSADLGGAVKKHPIHDKMSPPLYFQEISLEHNYLSMYNYNKDIGIHHATDREGERGFGNDF